MKSINELLVLLKEQFKKTKKAAGVTGGLCFAAYLMLHKEVITAKELRKLRKYIMSKKNHENIKVRPHQLIWKDSDTKSRVKWLDVNIKKTYKLTQK